MGSNFYNVRDVVGIQQIVCVITKMICDSI